MRNIQLYSRARDTYRNQAQCSRSEIGEIRTMNKRIQLASRFAKSIAVGILAYTMGPSFAETVDRSEEARSVVESIENTHPRGPALAQSEAWREESDHYVQTANELDDPDYMVSLIGLLAFLEDGHTTIPIGQVLGDGTFPMRLPIRLRAFDDGLYVIAAKGPASTLLGGRVLSLGSLTIEEIMSRFADIWPGDNVAWVQHDAGLLGLPALLAGLDVIDTETSEVPISVLFEDGETRSTTLQPSLNGGADRVDLIRPLSRSEIWAAENGQSNFISYLPIENVIFVSISEVRDTNDQTIASLTDDLALILEKETPNRIIIDLRLNTGGDNTLMERFRRIISTSTINRPGGIVVLIRPQTFSAAVNVASRFERDTFALFVGAPTGAGPNHFGEAKTFRGHKTNLPYIVSTFHWQDSTPEDQRRWIMPDVAVPLLFSDWTTGRDLALQVAMNPDLEVFEFSDARWFSPWIRDSQQKEWFPFWVNNN
jgi:hypothetical protein